MAFVTGLRQDSRTKMAINGMKVPTNTLIMAMVYDKLNLWIWANSKEGRKGKNKPASLTDLLSKDPPEKNVVAFDKGDDFDAAYQRIIQGG